MSDTDALTLQEAGQAVLTIDVRSRTLPTIDDRETIKPARDAAFSAYSAARLALLQEGVITTPADVAAMRMLRTEIERAAEVQALLSVALRTAEWLAGLAMRV